MVLSSLCFESFFGEKRRRVITFVLPFVACLPRQAGYAQETVERRLVAASLPEG